MQIQTAGMAYGTNTVGNLSTKNGRAKTEQSVKTGEAEKSKQACSASKPIWNPNRVYKYLEDMNEGFQSYKREAVTYYSARIAAEEGDGVLTVDELKEQIKEWFPEYTLTDSEPGKVVQGKFYLYIDERQLKKLAQDPAYRARVYGLMDSELQGKKGYTLQYSDGKNVTAHLTGSIFSLAEKNGKYAGADGIPYLGSCTSDHSFSSSASHPQVRSMSFLYDNLDPAKSAARDRKANSAKAEEKKLRAKRAEEKRAEKKRAEKKREKKKAAERSEEEAERVDNGENGAEEQSLLYDMAQCMLAGAHYQSHADIDAEKTEDSITEQKLGSRTLIDGGKDEESAKGSVTFNEAKRARQLASAVSPENVRTVMGLLAKDLSDCENGLADGMCDEEEVAKVKAMIQKAQQRMAEVTATGTTDDKDDGFDAFSINMLM